MQRRGSTSRSHGISTLLGPSASTTTSSPGATSRTNVAPMTLRAGDSEASTQPLGASAGPSRPRQSGRKPNGSRTPKSRSELIRTKENAPSSSGSAACNAVARSSVSGKECASNSATTSLSVTTDPGSMPTFSASAGVLVRFPLCPSAKPAFPTGRYTGWAPAQSDAPWVE